MRTGKNVAVNGSADASDKAVNNTQWNPGNLVDGDTGMDSDRGYTSDMLGSGQSALKLQTPSPLPWILRKRFPFRL